MANQITFKIDGLSSALTNEYAQVTDTLRFELLSGQILTTDASGNATISLGGLGTPGQSVIVKGDDYLTAGAAMKGFSYHGTVEEIVINYDGIAVDLSSVPELDWFTATETIFVDGSTTYDPVVFRDTEFTGSTYYLGYAGASDSNDGLTQLTSWATMQHSITNTSDGDIVRVAAGDHWNNGWITSFGLSAGAAYIGEDGANLWACSEDDSSLFSLDATYTNSYSATFAELFSVWDMSLDNPYWSALGTSMPNLGWMTEQSSAADVDANPNSWYYDGSTLYVRTHDDRAPDSDIKCMTFEECRIGSNDASNYWENLNVVGMGMIPSSFLSGGTVVMNNIRCGYTKDVALTATGGDMSAYIIRKDCYAFSGYDDMYSGRGTCNILDINCYGGDSPTPGSNNASTGHDGCNFTRLGGQYYDVNSKVIGNIQSGIAVHVGVNSYKTYDVGFTANDSDYGTGSSVSRNIYIGCTELQPNGDPSESTYSIYGTGLCEVQGNSFAKGFFSGVTTLDVEFYEEP